ncbi:MAG: kynureninase [Candidatus Melainabacteria bacterium HGW-Melainabacteria-1]|nr:MAG: kynureninase [Candidatus Melainabacteria bacterium HGW-Melainabacteria-1]
MRYRASREFAQLMDGNDPLREYRARFHIPAGQTRAESLYFCGHSLGLQPRLARDLVNAELDAWEQLAVRAHFEGPHPWKYYHELLTDATARLVGAQPGEVVVMNSLTTNLHLMMVSFYQPTLDRPKILIEANAFPSDRYAVESQLRFHKFDPEHDLMLVQPGPDETGVRTERVLEALAAHGEDIALVLLGGVNYVSGQLLDIRAITRAAHESGCLVGIDLAHAAGNVVLKLHDWDVDFAVWCSYKYLNGGPGSLGGCFVHQRHADTDRPRFAGWWGHDQQSRFLMPDAFRPEVGAEGWQLSNPAILALAAQRAAMQIFDEVPMESLRAKSRLLTGYLEFLLDQLADPRLQQITPRDPIQRGCQLSLRVEGADRSLHRTLMARDVICDWREPDILRLAPVPLYNSFLDVFEAVEILKAGLNP